MAIYAKNTDNFEPYVCEKKKIVAFSIRSPRHLFIFSVSKLATLKSKWIANIIKRIPFANFSHSFFQSKIPFCQRFLSLSLSLALVLDFIFVVVFNLLNLLLFRESNFISTQSFCLFKT